MIESQDSDLSTSINYYVAIRGNQKFCIALPNKMEIQFMISYNNMEIYLWIHAIHAMEVCHVLEHVIVIRYVDFQPYLSRNKANINP